MKMVRTDLAMEAREAAGEIEGVSMEQDRQGEALITRVCVQTEEGSQAIGKPIGSYITIERGDLYKAEAQTDEELMRCVAQELTALTGNKTDGTCLVVGLGNRELTPDSLGPRVASQVLASRHLLELFDREALPVRPVCVLSPGVMGETGMETGEVVQAVANKIRPEIVIVVDALAARSTSRILSTVQLTDSGVAPGSGVGNHRDALTQETLGVPVIAIGVPMVVHAATILRDALEKIAGEEMPTNALLRSIEGENLVVTPVMIDEAVRNVSTLIAHAINVSLQKELTQEEICSLRI